MTLIETARQYLGQTEKPGNLGFPDRIFDEKMRHIGFQNGSPWCGYFVRLCIYETHPHRWDELSKLFTPHCITTFNKCKAAGLVILTVPRPKAIVIWQHGKTTSGHTGIVETVKENGQFTSIEGNTNGKGSRNGDRVAQQVRPNNLEKSASGLWVRGFIIIPE